MVDLGTISNRGVIMTTDDENAVDWSGTFAQLITGDNLEKYLDDNDLWVK